MSGSFGALGGFVMIIVAWYAAVSTALYTKSFTSVSRVYCQHIINESSHDMQHAVCYVFNNGGLSKPSLGFMKGD